MGTSPRSLTLGAIATGHKLQAPAPGASPAPWRRPKPSDPTPHSRVPAGLRGNGAEGQSGRTGSSDGWRRQGPGRPPEGLHLVGRGTSRARTSHCPQPLLGPLPSSASRALSESRPPPGEMSPASPCGSSPRGHLPTGPCLRDTRLAPSLPRNASRHRGTSCLCHISTMSAFITKSGDAEEVKCWNQYTVLQPKSQTSRGPSSWERPSVYFTRLGTVL